MAIFKPHSVLAGFHADLPDPGVPELAHVGEEWIPTDYRIPEHSHGVWEFYFQIDGETRWQAGGKRVELAAGGLLAVAPGVAHRLITPTPAAHHFFFAGIDIMRAVAAGGRAQEAWRNAGSLFTRHAPEIAPAFRRLVREVTMKAEFREEALRLALRLLALELTRCLLAEAGPSSLLPRHPAVMRARELIDHQPGKDWTVHSLAVMAGLSASRLSACFKEEIGMSPHRYHMRARVEAARALLAGSDLPVTAIAMELGYASSQHFASAFKAATGMSPRQCRSGRDRRGAKAVRDAGNGGGRGGRWSR